MLNNSKTLVVGLGEVGGALAEVLEHKHPILKHDVERRDFSDPIRHNAHCIPFVSRAQFEPLALEYIRRFKPQLTIINSTVLPEAPPDRFRKKPRARWSITRSAKAST